MAAHFSWRDACCVCTFREKKAFSFEIDGEGGGHICALTWTGKLSILKNIMDTR